MYISTICIALIVTTLILGKVFIKSRWWRNWLALYNSGTGERIYNSTPPTELGEYVVQVRNILIDLGNHKKDDLTDAEVAELIKLINKIRLLNTSAINIPAACLDDPVTFRNEWLLPCVERMRNDIASFTKND